MLLNYSIAINWNSSSRIKQLALLHQIINKKRIIYGKDILFKSEEELLEGPEFKEECLAEVKDLLVTLGLQLSVYGSIGWAPSILRQDILQKMYPEMENKKLPEPWLIAPFNLHIEDVSSFSDKTKGILIEEGILRVRDLVIMTETQPLELKDLDEESLHEVIPYLSMVKFRRRNLNPSMFPPFALSIDNVPSFSDKTTITLLTEGILYVGDLVLWTETELLELKDFDQESLHEVKNFLATLNLHLNPHPNWNPQERLRIEFRSSYPRSW